MRGTSQVDFPRPETSGSGRDNDTLGQVVAALHQLRTVVQEMRDQLAGVAKTHYTVEEVARMTARSSYTIRRWISEGQIRAERVTGTGPRGRLLIPHEEIAKLISRGKGTSIPDALAQQ